MNNKINNLIIASNIKALRIKNHMTQMQMGDALGYSERQIRRLETAGTYDLGVINLIAETFNVSAIGILS